MPIIHSIMPMFFFISGMWFRDRKPREYVIRKAKSYLILNSDQIKKDKEMKNIIVTELNSDKRKGMQKLVKIIK